MSYFFYTRGWNVLESERRFIPGITYAEEIQKSASMELHKWSKNVEICRKSPIFEGKLQVFITYMSEMKTVTMLHNFPLF